ncbi:MAG: hypothetical protein Kow00109_13980 [Acidobacteriota bacterium]
MSELIKTRRLRLARRPTEQERAFLYAHLPKQRGIRSCSIEEDGTVEVTYDLFQIRLPEILEVLTSAGFEPSRSWRDRLRRWFAAYTEQNELDNLTAPESPCCSNPKLKAP